MKADRKKPGEFQTGSMFVVRGVGEEEGMTINTGLLFGAMEIF